MKEIKTHHYSIGDNSQCYLIAEIGSNHNGNYDQACEMIEKAAEAGVNAVKFQTFKAASHYSKSTPKINLYKQDVYSLIESLEIDRSWHKKLAILCKKKKVDFLDSPCDAEAVAIAVSVDMPILKVASFDMVDSRLVDQISKTGRSTMFSVGMANMAEIEQAVNICRKNNNDQIIILQCTSIYPAPAQLSNLRAMKTIRNAFNVIVGYSDHTLGDHIPCAAVALGAKVIEKHYTLSRSLKGPDHAFAIEPNELREMILKIRDVESALGNGMKNGPRKEEMEFYNKARRSIIAADTLQKGRKIKSSDIIVKRPGFGIHPSMLDLVVGRVIKEEIQKDEPITWNKI